MKIILIVLGAGTVVVSCLFTFGVYAIYSATKFMNESKFY